VNGADRDNLQGWNECGGWSPNPPEEDNLVASGLAGAGGDSTPGGGVARDGTPHGDDEGKESPVGGADKGRFGPPG
jgi:hypothetical protein